MLSLGRLFSKKQGNLKNLLSENFKEVLLYLKHNSQNHKIEKILQQIGYIFNSAGLGIFITIIDNQQKMLYFRYISTTEKKIDLIFKQWEKLPTSDLYKYSEVLKNKKPLFCLNRLSKLVKHYPRLSDAIDIKSLPADVNSIILPLALENKIIGFFEIFSPNLTENDIKAADDFSQELIARLVQIILFKQIIVAEENLDKLSELNQIILDHAPISIITINRQGEITSANKCFFEFSGSKSFVNKNIFKTPFFIREGLIDSYKKLLQTGEPVRKDNCYTKNYDHKVKFLNIVAVPIKNKTGEINGAISMAIDNSKAYQAKNELEALNKQLEKKVAERTEQLDI
ncbi:MAG: PAS domain-containing protein, partial [bacterium]